MSGYFISVFVICSGFGVLGILSYDEKNKAQRAALGIIFLYVVLAPVAENLKSVGDATVDFEGIADEYGDEGYEQIGETALSNGIRRAIAEKFSVSEGDVSVILRNFDFNEMKSDSVSVILTGKAVFSDSIAIKKFVNDLGVGKCEVEISIGG